MSPLEEPSLSELIRDVQAQCAQILEQQRSFVVKETNDLLHEKHSRRLDALEESKRSTTRLVISAFVAPILTGLILFVLLGGGGK